CSTNSQPVFSTVAGKFPCKLLNPVIVGKANPKSWFPVLSLYQLEFNKTLSFHRPMSSASSVFVFFSQWKWELWSLLGTTPPLLREFGRKFIVLYVSLYL